MQVVLVPNFVTVDIIREINVILNLFRNLIISNEILYFYTNTTRRKQVIFICMLRDC